MYDVVPAEDRMRYDVIAYDNVAYDVVPADGRKGNDIVPANAGKRHDVVPPEDGKGPCRGRSRAKGGVVPWAGSNTTSS